MEEQGLPQPLPKRQRAEPPPFSPLCHDRILKEAKIFAQEHENMNRLWDEECEKYNGSMQVCVNGEHLTVPRRNYLNDEGIVHDVTLFPYHTSCYALVDAYDCPYEEGASAAARAYPRSRRLEYDVRFGDMSPLNGFVPSSVRAIFEALFPSLRHEESAATNYEESYWIAISEEAMSYRTACRTATGTTKKPPLPFGSKLPVDREKRVSVLLRLLRHSLSILQNDYKLAAAAVTMLSLFDLDDLNVFRRFLAVVSTTFVKYEPCERRKDERPDMHPSFVHYVGYCGFVDAIKSALTVGVTVMTGEHATCLVAFARFFLSPEFEWAIGDPCAHLSKDSVSFQRDVTGKPTAKLLEIIARVLGERGAIDRDNLLSGLQMIGRPDLTLDSYQNCVRALVGIAEVSVHFRHRSFRLTLHTVIGTLVLSLYKCLVRKDRFVELEFPDGEERDPFTLYRAVPLKGDSNSLRNLRLFSPLRFGNRISEATMTSQARWSGAERILEMGWSDSSMARMRLNLLIDSPPPTQIVSVVRALFLSKMVDIEYNTNMGYGDFLVWTGCDVSPLDPLLFSSENAFPFSDEVPDLEYDEFCFSDDRTAYWDCDEEDHQLTHLELHARYDFTLLLLQRAWQAPWCPENHASFQPPFRVAVKAVALCTHRLGLPHDAMMKICSFLHRDWWSDSRKQCWNLECQRQQSLDSIAQLVTGVDSKSPTSTLEYCPGCHVAMYCSEECRTTDYESGHGKKCGRPPFLSRPPGTKELLLCREVFNEATLPGFLTSRFQEPCYNEQNIVVNGAPVADVELAVAEDDGNDDDSCDTMSTNEQKQTAGSTTTKIYQYFKNESYKHYKEWYARGDDDNDDDSD